MNPLLRFALLCLIGLVLAPVSGYFAGLVFGKEIVIWFVATLFGVFIDGAKAVFTMLVLPGVLGLSWAWPVTCVVFPLVALVVRGSARSPLWFGAIGAVAGAFTAWAWIATGLKPLQADLGGYLLGGAVGCLAAGVIFGFALRRIDAPRVPTTVTRP